MSSYTLWNSYPQQLITVKPTAICILQAKVFPFMKGGKHDFSRPGKPRPRSDRAVNHFSIRIYEDCRQSPRTAWHGALHLGWRHSGMLFFYGSEEIVILATYGKARDSSIWNLWNWGGVGGTDRAEACLSAGAVWLLNDAARFQIGGLFKTTQNTQLKVPLRRLFLIINNSLSISAEQKYEFERKTSSCQLRELP